MQLCQNTAKILKADVSASIVDIVDEVQHFSFCRVAANSPQSPDQTLNNTSHSSHKDNQLRIVISLRKYF